MARNSHSSKSLFESVDNVTVFKSEGIGLTDSLPQDDGTLAPTESRPSVCLIMTTKLLVESMPPQYY